MKAIFFLSITLLTFASCNSQKSKAIEDQQKAYDVLKTLPNGAIATADGSWTMTAKINGNVWQANYIYPPEAAARIIGHYNDEFISLPYDPYWKQGMKVGAKTTFNEHNAINLNLTDDIGLYWGIEGEMLITKVSNGWAEGTFHFITDAKRNPGVKPIEVTDGFFRVKISDK